MAGAGAWPSAKTTPVMPIPHHGPSRLASVPNMKPRKNSSSTTGAIRQISDRVGGEHDERVLGLDVLDERLLVGRAEDPRPAAP